MKESDRDYLFEQFRVDRGCLGYIIADSRSAAIFDPELEMVEPMLDFIFEHGLKPAYIVDTHTHADHISGGPSLRSWRCDFFSVPTNHFARHGSAAGVTPWLRPR